MDIIIKYLDSNIEKIIGNNFEILNYKIYDFLSSLNNNITGNSYLIMYSYIFISLIRTNNNHYIVNKNIRLNNENKKFIKK